MNAKVLDFEEHDNIEHGLQVFYYVQNTVMYTAHGHSFYEIIIVSRGSAHHICNENKTTIARGTLILIRPGDIHQFKKASKDFAFYNIVFSQDAAQKVFSFYDFKLEEHLHGSNHPPSIKVSNSEISDLSARCKLDIDTTDLQKRSLYNLALLSSLLPLFFSHSNHKKDIPIWFSSILDEIHSNNNFVKGLPFLHSISTRSKEHVSRCFKKYTGMTAVEYINHLKLTYAANLLKQTNIDLLEISMMLNFNSHSHFYHLFKAKFNCTPKQYRNNHGKLIF